MATILLNHIMSPLFRWPLRKILACMDVEYFPTTLEIFLSTSRKISENDSRASKNVQKIAIVVFRTCEMSTKGFFLSVDIPDHLRLSCHTFRMPWKYLSSKYLLSHAEMSMIMLSQEPKVLGNLLFFFQGGQK